MTSNEPHAPNGSRIAWIGTGVMGAPMCGRLIDAGCEAAVFNRTPSKANALLARGARWTDSPAEATASADVVFTIVGWPRDVREAYFGRNGVLTAAREGQILIDMTTTEPTLAAEIAQAAAASGACALDAPVSGGDVGARNGTLSIMAGGDRPAFDRVLPLLKVLGRSIVHQGCAGSGQHAKMCNQIVIAGTMIGVCESLLYARQAGLDIEKTLRAIGGGAAGCWTLENLAPRCVRRDFEPGFFIEHFIKDMGVALEEAERMGLALPGLALARQLYEAAKAQGFGRKGVQALLLALERLNGIENVGA